MSENELLRLLEGDAAKGPLVLITEPDPETDLGEFRHNTSSGVWPDGVLWPARLWGEEDRSYLDRLLRLVRRECQFWDSAHPSAVFQGLNEIYFSLHRLEHRYRLIYCLLLAARFLRTDQADSPYHVMVCQGQTMTGLWLPAQNFLRRYLPEG